VTTVYYELPQPPAHRLSCFVCVGIVKATMMSLPDVAAKIEALELDGNDDAIVWIRYIDLIKEHHLPPVQAATVRSLYPPLWGNGITAVLDLCATHALAINPPKPATPEEKAEAERPREEQARAQRLANLGLVAGGVTATRPIRQGG
jgi:hypothetical protein